jgi:hypothetical protein
VGLFGLRAHYVERIPIHVWTDPECANCNQLPSFPGKGGGMSIDRKMVLRKAATAGVLEQMCQTLELTATQYETAKSRYESVGSWLAEAENPLLRALNIYPQGSTALGTTVKPIGRNEHDVDLVAHMPNLGSHLSPAVVKKVIGDRLREHGKYAPLLVEKQRCWRLDYANEFHLDITPSINNPDCSNGGELVPDRALKEWKASNPKGYSALFGRRAELQPRMRTVKSAQEAFDRAMENVEPYPVATGLKGMLRRTIQIAKRHRDVYFTDLDPCLPPISVIITTLAARSYEYCVGNFVYDSELDVVQDILRHMPSFIEKRIVQGSTHWFIWNETTSGENFAEKWNADPSRAEAFFAWHNRATTDLDRLANIEGIDLLNKNLSESFGPGPVKQVFDAMTQNVSTARRTGQLFVAPTVGLTVAATTATPVRANTFFGAI